MSDDRTIRVRLHADILQYQQAMAKAGKSTADFGRQISGHGQAAQKDIERVGRSALVVGGVMAVGFAKGIQVGMGFEKQMSNVAAVSNATADQMERLSDAALAAGASTRLAGVTASDAARAEAELVRAGVSVSDVLGGALMGSLTLASAGQLDFADAATIAAQAMNIFDLRGGAVTHVADVLAAAANKSAADVGQLGDALRQGGLVASQYGLSLEDTVAGLAAFADNALVGSDAGTALKTMLQRLSPISKESESLMEEIGFSAYDAAGNFVGLTGVADELQTSLAGMTQQQRATTLAQLFGSDAVRGANVLFEEGAAGIRDYVAAVNDEGAAARMAAIQNDNLAGDVEALGGAFESALIQNGSKATGALRGITQGATNLVNGFSAMPDVVQSSAVGFGAVATAGLLAVGVIGTVGPKVAQAKSSLEGMGKSGQFLAANMGKVAGALGAVGAGFAAFAAYEGMLADARSEAEEWSSTWESLAFGAANTTGLDEFRAALGRVNVEWQGLTEDAAGSDAPWDADKQAQYEQGAEALGGISAEMTRISDVSGDLAAAFGVSGDAALEFVLGQRAAGVDVLAQDYESFLQAMQDLWGQMPVVGSGLEGTTDALGDNAEAAEAAEKAFKDLMDAYRGAVDPLFGMLDALDANKAALAAQGEAAAEGAARVADAQEGVADAQRSLDEARRGGNAESIGAAERRLADAQARLTEEQAEAVITAEELAAMNREVATSALDVMTAAQRLAHDIDTGKVSLEEAKGMLEAWTTAGLITAEQAAQVGTQFDEAALRGIAYAGDYVATVSVAGVDQAISQIEMVSTAIGNVPKYVPVGFIGPLLPGQEHTPGPVQHPAAGGLIPHLAMGGFPGSPSGSDTVPAWLTPGEFVLQKSAVDQLGAGALNALNDGLIPSAPAPGAGGGSRDVYLGGVSLTYPKPEELSVAVPRTVRKMMAMVG